MPRSLLDTKASFSVSAFFKLAMQPKNLIYVSDPYHAELHWESPYEPYHVDLYFLLKSTRDTGQQFLFLTNKDNANYQGLEYIFALFFMSFCRTFIFIKTYYLPNSLSNLTLWKLCIYADPDILKYEFLIKQFGVDFFGFLDRHQTLHQRLSKLDDLVVGQMIVIVEKLIGELEEYNI